MINTINQDAPQLWELNTVFGNVVFVALTLAGFALLIMLVMGGIKYLTSGDDPKAAESAKQTLTYAILGVVLVASAFLILRFISQFTGVEGILNFNIYRTN